MQGVELDVDGSIFSFPVGWEAQKYDEWALARKLSGGVINAKACDIVAIGDDVLYLIEAKDYTFPVGTRMPPLKDLATTIALKGFHTLAGLHAGARIEGDQAEFCRRALACSRVELCLTVEPPTDSGFLLKASEIQREILGLLRTRAKPFLAHRPIVVSHGSGNVPWTAAWTPERRAARAGR